MYYNRRIVILINEIINWLHTNKYNRYDRNMNARYDKYNNMGVMDTAPSKKWVSITLLVAEYKQQYNEQSVKRKQKM